MAWTISKSRTSRVASPLWARETIRGLRVKIYPATGVLFATEHFRRPVSRSDTIRQGAPLFAANNSNFKARAWRSAWRNIKSGRARFPLPPLCLFLVPPRSKRSFFALRWNPGKPENFPWNLLPRKHPPLHSCTQDLFRLLKIMDSFDEIKWKWNKLSCVQGETV